MDIWENWATIEDFERYLVSDHGRVCNIKTGRLMDFTVNQMGIPYVGLSRARIQDNRSVPLLVAKAFVPKPDNEAFDTPIQLDGNRLNCYAGNLMWRPRWFAIQFHKQFKEPFHSPITKPMIDVKTGDVYDNSLHVAVVNGLLEREVVFSYLNNVWVWPTYQKFAIAENTY